MSLFDELEAEESTSGYAGRESQIVAFLDTLEPSDRAKFDAWMVRESKNTSAMYRVLKRRGIPVALSTFRNWVADACL